jgi:hypothetical protein
MKRLIAASSSLTLVNVPRRMACRVMIPKNHLSGQPVMRSLVALDH